MRLLFSAIFVLFSSTILYAQDCVKPKIYGHSVECLFENRAIIHTYQGYGFADETGKIVIPMQYDKAWQFKNGLAKVERNKRYGLIDKSGKIIIPPQYNELNYFTDKLVRTRHNNQYELFDTQGNIISDKYDFIGNIDYGFAKIKQQDKYGLMDKNGKIIIPCEYDDILTLTKEPDLIAVKKNNAWGFVDKNNHTVIPFVYEQVWHFHNGLAKIRNNQQYGMIDLTGKIIIPTQYQWLSDANEQGVMVFKQDNHFGLINKDNQIFREAKSEKIADFNHILIKKETVSINKTAEENSPQDKQSDNTKYDFEKIDGKYVISENILANKTVIITENNQYGLADATGKIILPVEYNYISVISEDRFKIQKNKQYGIADSQGNILLSIEYDEIFDFEDGLATVKKNEKNGVVDLDGRIIVPIIYDISIHPFKNGLAEVREDWKRGLVNLSGEIVLPIEYHRIGDFKNGFAVIEHPSGDGVIDQKLNFILPPEYYHIGFFEKGFAKISIKGNDWGYLNQHGQVVVQGVEYDRVEPFNNGVAKIYKGNKAWRVDYSGQVFGIPEENKQQKENNQTKDKEYLNHLKEIERFRKSNQ
ncbi:MAG: WG repeat-containing protein [Neisseriaceae bacterium]|nr:WG repeat-containing protein [Neisseriaceae bacterium]